MRRDVASDPAARVERTAGVVRQSGSGHAWNAVVWSGLDESTADEAIAEQLRHFAALGVGFEWKLYGHDRPADLGDRLVAAGFVPEEPETLMVAAIGELALDTALPDGVHLLRITDAAGVDLMMRAGVQAFGAEVPGLRQRLKAQLADDPDSVHAFVVMAGDEPVCGARMDLHPGTAFASLWGGGTVRAWRGRGIYRALVAHRARIAADLGYTYLQVDATDESRPILQRLGFAALTTTTPYEMPAPPR